jgi:small subunit ribosomal protein S16
MSVRLRLTRVGSKKNPIWRLVATDQRSPRDGRFIETLGHYNPQTEPSTIVIDQDRVEHWLARGAQPSETVRRLIRVHAAGGGAPSADAIASSGGSAVAVAEPPAEQAASEQPPEGEVEQPAPEGAEATEAAAEPAAPPADGEAEPAPADAEAGDGETS